MKKINIHRLYRQFSQKYMTLNNGVIAIGLVIAAFFVIGSLDVMQKNYKLQRELDEKSRQLIVAQLDTSSAELEQLYYKTYEYQELAVRERLGLAAPGESVIILPKNIKTAETSTTINSTSVQEETKSNWYLWMNFLFGGNSEGMSK